MHAASGYDPRIVTGRALPSNPFGGMTLTPAPPDVVVLFAVVFATYVAQFFDATRIVPALLHLSPGIWMAGFVWKLVTYPFAGYGAASPWIVLELLFGFFFGRDLYYRLGRGRFWRTLLTVAVVAALAACAVEMALRATSGGHPAPFTLMQGQRLLITVFIAGFATLMGEATILLFFVLPLKARWFLGLEVLFAFLAYLGTKDLAGFVGLLVAVGLTWALLTRRGPRRALRELWLRFQERRMRAKLDRLRKKRGFRVVPGGGEGGGGNVTPGPWLN